MSKMEEQATYGRIVHIGPADERGRVTVTHEDGTSVTVRKDQLPPMSTTNDEQAPYGKQDQRAPMLSYDDMVRECWDENACGERSYWTEPWTAEEVGDFYEDLITKGVLRVVKKANNNGSPSVFYCSSCNFLVDGQNGIPVFNFCPGCGSEITKQ